MKKRNQELNRNIVQDLKEFPCYKVEHRTLVRIPTPPSWMWVHLHHYIRTGWIKRNPEKWEQVKHLQKLIFLNPVMHLELHNKHRKFKEKYGIEIKELLFDWREFMLDARIAKNKSNANGVKLRLEHVEKLIDKAVAKGETSAFVLGEIDKSILEKLAEYHYEYEFQANGLKIMW